MGRSPSSMRRSCDRIKIESVVGKKDGSYLRRIGVLCLCALTARVQLYAAGIVDPLLPAYRAEQAVRAELNSLGDNTMDTLMNDWLRAFQVSQPKVQKGSHWEFLGTAVAISALMFE